jgi:hypothetical protein
MHGEHRRAENEHDIAMTTRFCVVIALARMTNAKIVGPNWVNC